MSATGSLPFQLRGKLVLRIPGPRPGTPTTGPTGKDERGGSPVDGGSEDVGCGTDGFDGDPTSWWRGSVEGKHKDVEPRLQVIPTQLWNEEGHQLLDLRELQRLPLIPPVFPGTNSTNPRATSSEPTQGYISDGHRSNEMEEAPKKWESRRFKEARILKEEIGDAFKRYLEKADAFDELLRNLPYGNEGHVADCSAFTTSTKDGKELGWVTTATIREWLLWVITNLHPLPGPPYPWNLSTPRSVPPLDGPVLLPSSSEDPSPGDVGQQPDDECNGDAAMVGELPSELEPVPHGEPRGLLRGDKIHERDRQESGRRKGGGEDGTGSGDGGSSIECSRRPGRR